MNDMIVLNDVTKSFLSDRSIKDKDGKPHWFTAVEPTSLTIKQGEIFGLMGYSGAGSNALVGSSANSTFGLGAIARAIPTRCFCPPDS